MKRLRAGQVPEWAFDQKIEGKVYETEDKLKYKGVTGDGAGIVLDMGNLDENSKIGEV